MFKSVASCGAKGFHCSLPGGFPRSICPKKGSTQQGGGVLHEPSPFPFRRSPMRAREVMTPRPACCTPDDTARDVATVMRDRDCGCVPIIDQSTAKLLGI